MWFRRSLAAAIVSLALVAAQPSPMNADYSIPSPLPPGPPGTLLRQRPLRDGAAIPGAARNLLLLYITRNPLGRRVAVSGTLAIPRGNPPPGGWPIVSWAHGTTGNAPKCAPSRDPIPNVEQRMLAEWLRAGYAVAQTDYEGEGTPGIHPYFDAVASTHDLTDIVRAARTIDPAIGRRWIVMGHSEGGTAAIAAAARAPSWAPHLDLVGAVAYAPASHIARSLQIMAQSTSASPILPLVAMMIEGIGLADPSIDLTRVLSPAALRHQPELQHRCAGALMRDLWWSATPTDRYFRHPLAIGPLLADFRRNDPGRLMPRVPLLLVQGSADKLVGPAATADLRAQICLLGGNVGLRSIPGGTHDSILQTAQPAVLQWVAARFAGAPAHSSCGDVP